MSNEIAPLTAVQDKIKGRIKAEFVELIPDEMWSQMVQAVVTEFTSDKTDRYSREAIPSPIKKMIREAVEAEVRAKISDELKDHQATFDGFGQRVIAEATEQMIRDHMPGMLAAAQESSVRMMVDLAIQNMRNSMGQY